MKKEDFLNKLRIKLSNLPKEDLDERINFYSEMIDDRIEDGFQEEEAINDIGTLDEVSRQVIANYPLKKLIKESRVFPCFSGAALQDEGIVEFLQALEELTFTEYNKNNEFSGIVYKIRHDNNGTKITFIKALSGILKVRDELNVIREDEDLKEKISSIRVYNGSKFTTVDKVEAGDIFAIVGPTMLNIGDGLGTLNTKTSLNMTPTLMSKVIFDKSYNIKEVLKYFKILEAEDPSLNVIWNEAHKEIQVHIMGKIQLEVLREVVSDRFNLEVDFGPCEIMYKETIKNKVFGYGHFEPLKHYSEVHLKIEPQLRGTGIIFENKCHADNLTTGHQNLIKTHIFERKHNGLLTGSEITDLKITLLTGRAHNKHTEGGDFREATFRAIRQGLEKAENILLEPFYKFKIDVELDSFGEYVDSRSFASEGHLDTLGLCIFLAFNKQFNDLNLIVLDDVLTTVDEVHKERIARLLLEEFEDYQFILTAHDKIWVDDLESLCMEYNRENVIYEIEDWSLEEGPVISKR